MGDCLAANSGHSGCISCSATDLLCALGQVVHPQLPASVLMWGRNKALIPHGKYSKVWVKVGVCFGGKEGKKSSRRGCKTTQVFALYWFQLAPVEKAAGTIMCISAVLVAITAFHFSEVWWWFVRPFLFKLCWIILKVFLFRLLSAYPVPWSGPHSMEVVTSVLGRAEFNPVFENCCTVFQAERWTQGSSWRLYEKAWRTKNSVHVITLGKDEGED